MNIVVGKGDGEKGGVIINEYNHIGDNRRGAATVYGNDIEDKKGSIEYKSLDKINKSQKSMQ